MKKLAIITTHPVQYYAPVFKLLNKRKILDIKVYYSWGEMGNSKHDPGFEKTIEWDLPLLEGYQFEWVNNTAKKPGSHHFSGIKNPNLIQQITDWKPDAVFVFGWAYQSHLQVLRHFKGKKLVYFRGDSTLLDDKVGVTLFIKRLFLKWVYRHVDHAFYVGTQNKKYFLQYGIKNTRLTFTPHATDNKRFAEDRLEEARILRNKLGIGSEDILVLFAGKFERKKDPMLLLDAFIKINKPNIHLLFAGNGELENEMKAHASAQPISTNIHFWDFQNQTKMPVLYQACDLFSLPSRGPGESWGLSINEAMACGKAILVSDKTGAATDLVTSGENGYIFQSGNPADLKEKLSLLTCSKSRLEEWGKKSREKIHAWNILTIAAAIEQQVVTDFQEKSASNK